MAESARQRQTKTTAPAESWFTLRTKFVITLLTIGLLPLGFVVLHILTNVQDHWLEMRSLVADSHALQAADDELTRIKASAYTITAINVVLIIGASFFAEYFFSGRIRTLLAWVRDMREHKFTKIVASPVPSNDEIGLLGEEMSKTIAYLQDVEKRERLIAQQKVEFISIAAHQLRTPLTGLRWGVDSMSQKSKTENEKRIAIGMKATIDRMITLVDDLLDVAKLEEGRFGYNFQIIDIMPMLQKTIEHFALIAESKKVNLTYTHEEIPPVYVDPARISIVIANLLSNAISYTPEKGSVTLTVKDTGKHVQMSVSDTGIGIPENDIPKLFSKFSRSENAVRMHPDGSGLGLYIVRNIVERHGSNVSVKSSMGKGTTFSFLIPKDEKALAPKERVSVESLFQSL